MNLNDLVGRTIEEVGPCGDLGFTLKVSGIDGHIRVQPGRCGLIIQHVFEREEIVKVTKVKEMKIGNS